MNSEKVFAVIMAGGRGTRFWPASVRSRPKQFMDLLGGGTMIQLTAARFRNLADPSCIMVVTGGDHRETVLSQLPLIRENNVLLEPVGRNTAACLGWAAETLKRRGCGDCIMVAAASDHMIEPLEGFEKTIGNAVELASEGHLCTIGIPPSHPATGYGYIQRGGIAGPGWKVRQFREKPDKNTAVSYVESGEYFWNSGMFIWKVDSFLHELEKYMPGLHSSIEALPDTQNPSLETYGALESQSVDYGVMEKTDRAVVVEADFKWSDIGDWPGAREAGVEKGDKILLDSDNTLVYDETGRLTVVVGLSGVSVVSTDRATLVMADKSSQRIKEIVEELDRSKPDMV